MLSLQDKFGPLKDKRTKKDEFALMLKMIYLQNFSSLGWLLNSGSGISRATPELALISPDVCLAFGICLASHSLAVPRSNLQCTNLALISHLGSKWKSLDFFLNSYQQLITAVKADVNENQPRVLKFGIHINFSVYMKIPINFFS